MASSTPGTGKTDSPVASTVIETSLHPAVRQQRVLACVSCQQRKIKCDRHFPCAHCLRGGISCVPASLVPRQRRRRFPERDLLQRLRHYEDLLRQNNVDFKPLHPTSPVSANAASISDGHASPAASRGQDSGAPEPVDDTRSDISSVERAPMKSDSKPV